MIGYLKGEVKEKTLSYALVVTNNVGFIVYCTPNHLSTLRENAESEFYTFLDVKENSLTLYGFQNPTEVNLFSLVQTVSGVGAKTALSILSIFTPDEFMNAVTTEDIEAIKRTPGIGNKAAQRLVLELKEKVSEVGSGEFSEAVSSGKNSDVKNNVIQALISLGWNKQNAGSVIETAIKEIKAADEGAEITEESLLKNCLRILGSSK